jgi:hypothetical protein
MLQPSLLSGGLALCAGLLLTVPALSTSEPAPPPEDDSGVGSGVTPELSWADFDGDGLDDALAVFDRGLALYANTGAGGLSERTAELGLDGLAVAAASWIDFDADGAPDLFLVSRSGAARLLHNEAGAAFVDITPASGLADAGEVLRAEWRDVDGDRREDLVLWTGEGLRVHHNAGGGIFRPGAAASGGVLAASGPSASWTPSGAPPRIAAMAIPKSCAKLVFDQATQSCIEASSYPQLGSLYPLTQDLNVRGGYVGVGTTSPQAKLHVQTAGVNALQATSDRIAALLTTTGTGSPALEVRSGGEHAAFFDGRLEVGTIFGPLGFYMPRVIVDAEGTSPSGAVRVQNSSAIETFSVRGSTATSSGAELRLLTGAGNLTVLANGGTIGGSLNMFTSSGMPTVQVQAAQVAGEGARIALLKANGQTSIVLDADQSGNGRITTQVLEITGGSDLAESFDTGGAECPPGSVLVIDPERPGELTLSRAPYDRRVAGVVSGAGGVRPGLQLGQEGVMDGTTPVALTGRVYVRCSAEGGPIAPGDLLTSSSAPGRAMRAADPERAFGAVIGKAMSSLEGESGLVLVLVGLQ